MRIHAAILLLATISASIASAQLQVGDVGDPDTWHIRGAKTFEADEIRETLRFDFDTLVAAHPRALLPKLPEVIGARLTEGFLHVGFPDPQVEASYNGTTQQIEIVIDEGVRCRTGEIVVSGVAADLADKIARRLTEKHQDLDDATPEFDQHGQILNWTGPDGKAVESDEPLWKKGDPAPFNQGMLKALHARIEKTFEAAGFYATEFTCKVVPRGAAANLEIDVVRLGVPATIRQIDVVGNQLNTDAEILRQANLKPGALFTTAIRERVLRDLWISGRFAEQRVAIEPVAGGVDVKITVTEAAHAPRLSEPLSREAHAMLKCRQWLITGEGKERDLVFTGEHEGIQTQLIMSRQGMLISIDPQPTPGSLPAYAIRMATDGVAMYETKQRRKLLINHPKLVVTLTTKLRIKGADAEKPFTIGFGMGVRTPRTDETHEFATATPLEFNLSAPPACFVAHASVSESEWDGSVLTLSRHNIVLRIDERTGELLENRWLSEDGNGVASMTTEVGRFTRQQEELRAGTVGHRNRFNPSAPVSSVLAFVTSTSLLPELSHFTGHDEEEVAATMKQLGAVRSLIDAGLLRPVDAFVLKDDNNEDDDDFEIPGPQDASGMFAAFARYGIGAADHLFARKSWPWTVTREVGFAVAGHRQHTDHALRELLQSDELGPLGHLALAELFAYLSNDAIAAAIAAQGATKLDDNHFRGDTDALLSKSLPHLLPVARWLGQLNEGQRAKLAKSFAVDPQFMEQIVSTIRDADDEQAPLAMLDAIDQLWTTRGRQLVQSRLQKIVAERGAAALEARKKAARTD